MIVKTDCEADGSFYSTSRDASYSHCTVCSCQLAVVTLPWLLAAFLATAAKQGPGGVITGGNNIYSA